MATVRLSDGTSLNVTNEASWENSDSSTCGFSGSAVLTAVQVGSCEISAAYQTVAGRLHIAVTPNTTTSPSPGPTPPGQPPGQPPPPPTTPTLTGLSITGNTNINVGQTTQLHAVAQYSDGSTQTVTASANWSSSAPATASVAGGLVVGLTPGTTTITATYSGLSAQTAVQVSAGAPALTSLSITGALTISVGQTTQLQATAHYSDGSSQNVTALSVWTSSAIPVGTVAAGLVVGVSAGTTTVSANYLGRSAAVSVQVVAPPTLVGLSITGSTNVAVGGTTQLQAVARYSDGSTQTVTALALWTSGAPLRATVAAGLVVGVLPGSSTLTATFSGFTAQVTVTVS